jgi:hypothetical protein
VGFPCEVLAQNDSIKITEKRYSFGRYDEKEVTKLEMKAELVDIYFLKEVTDLNIGLPPNFIDTNYKAESITIESDSNYEDYNSVFSLAYDIDSKLTEYRFYSCTKCGVKSYFYYAEYNKKGQLVEIRHQYNPENKCLISYFKSGKIKSLKFYEMGDKELHIKIKYTI